MEQVLETISDYETLGVNWYYKDTEKVWEKAKALGVGISV
jgi:hypothetical protein